MAKVPVVAFLGPPGSGKDTQTNFLVDKFGFTKIGSGDILRQMRARALAEPDNYEAAAVKDILDHGKYAPTLTIACQWYKILVDLVKRINSGDNSIRGIVFSGSPRKLSEALLIDDFFSTWPGAQVCELSAVLLDVSESRAFTRLANRRICVGCSRIFSGIGQELAIKLCASCGMELKPRHDDDIELAKSRMLEYKQYVLPAISFFEEKGRLVRVNGEEPIEAVKFNILKNIGLKQFS